MNVGRYSEGERFSFASSTTSTSYINTLSIDNININNQIMSARAFFSMDNFMYSPVSSCEDYFDFCPMSEVPIDIFEEFSVIAEIAAEQSKDSKETLADVKTEVESTCLNLNTSDLEQLPTNEINIKTEIKIEEHPLKTDSENDEENDHSDDSKSDILNRSFNSTEIAHFDLGEYVLGKRRLKIGNEPIINESRITTEQTIISPPIIENVKPKNDVFPKRTIQAGVKKLDLKARRYICEEDFDKSVSEDELEVDVETIFDENSLGLEAKNVNDLLEQFEANEKKCTRKVLKDDGVERNVNRQQQNKVQIKTEKVDAKVKPGTKLKAKVEPKKERRKKLSKELRPNLPLNIKTEKTDSNKTRDKIIQGEKTKIQSRKTAQQIPISKESLKVNNKRIESHQQQTSSNTRKEELFINSTKVITQPEKTTTSTKTPNLSNVKQNKNNQLSQELINRIKESHKKKSKITVIEPIDPSKKKVKVRTEVKTIPTSEPIIVQANNKEEQDTAGSCSHLVELDHSYCLPMPVNISTAKKETGSVSLVEDTTKQINRQPIVKNYDGKMMVSLLKVNTISHTAEMQKSKKKLNLEEYKMRRNAIVVKEDTKFVTSSTNTSAMKSEDQHKIAQDPQEVFRILAEGVLNAAPKSEKKSESSSLERSTSAVNSTIKKEVKLKEKKPVAVSIKADHRLEGKPKLPPDMEQIVLVNKGVNTDFWIPKGADPLAPVETLQKIRPLLEKAHNKINENSLISSMIEVIPKLIDEREFANMPKSQESCQDDVKLILNLSKNRKRCKTRNAETQTNVSLLDKRIYGRKRKLSAESSSSSHYSRESTFAKRSRTSPESRCSVSSNNSDASSRSSNYSGNRSWSYSSRSSYERPAYERTARYSRYPPASRSNTERDHLNAVEERRIIYVGRIGTDTTKRDLRRKFEKFGPINNITLHFRDIGENYGFVTFRYKEDAHEAYEHGNDDQSFPYYKISFGGRREFCKAAYSDLDNMRDDTYYRYHFRGSENTFERLLQEAKEQMNRKA